MSRPDEEPSYGVVGLQKCQGLLATGSPNPGTSIQELHWSVIKHVIDMHHQYYNVMKWTRKSTKNLSHLLFCSHYQLNIIIQCQHTDNLTGWTSPYLKAVTFWHLMHLRFWSEHQTRLLINSKSRIMIVSLYVILFPTLPFNAFLVSENLEGSTHINGHDLIMSTCTYG